MLFQVHWSFGELHSILGLLVIRTFSLVYSDHVLSRQRQLGTAIGSLAYAKALLCHDLGPHALLRDAYMFASPVVCDVDSRQGGHIVSRAR